MGWLLAVDAEKLNMKDMTSPKWQARKWQAVSEHVSHTFKVHLVCFIDPSLHCSRL
jgi:hypothetical protein